MRLGGFIVVSRFVWFNWPQIPQCTCPISHNAPFCKRNVHISLTKCCIVGHWSDTLWDLCDGSILDTSLYWTKTDCRRTLKLLILGLASGLWMRYGVAFVSSRSWAHFTNDSRLLTQISWEIHTDVHPQPAINLLQIFAYATTAQLSYHAQNFVAIIALECGWEQKEFPSNFNCYGKNT